MKFNPQPKPVKSTGKKPPSGEGLLFMRIWAERPHRCVNCKVNLGSEAKAHYFAHVKPKSTHPELRLEASNIWLLCVECHYAYDFSGREEFEARKK